MSPFFSNAWVLLVAVTVGFMGPSRALAQDAEPPPDGEDEAESPLPPPEEYPDEIAVDPEVDRERFAASPEDNWGIPEALSLYQASEEAYDEGRYHEAAAFLLRVIELDPEAPELYYNISLVYEHLQEFNRALEYLERYSEFDIDASERRRVERMMTRIRGARENLPPTPEPMTRTRVVVQRFGRADGVFWGVFAAALAVGIGSGVTGGLALDWASAADQFTLGRDGDLADYRYWVNVADTLALTTDILIGVAGAAAITALLLYVLRTHQVIEVRHEEEVADAGTDVGTNEGGEPADDATADDGDSDAAETPEPAATSSRPAGRARASLPLVAAGFGGVMIAWEF